MAFFTNDTVAAFMATSKKNGNFLTCVSGKNAHIIKDLNTCVCTNIIHKFVPVKLKNSTPCADCGKKRDDFEKSDHMQMDLCHGVGQERGVLLARALEKVHPDPNVAVALFDVVEAFLREHIGTNFAVKCKPCHVAENKASAPKASAAKASAPKASAPKASAAKASAPKASAPSTPAVSEASTRKARASCDQEVSSKLKK